MTKHTIRVLLIVPESSIASMGTWYANNIDAEDNCANWPKLNTSGSDADAATHRWCCTAMRVAAFRKLVVGLLQLSGISMPGDWDARSREEKFGWLIDQRGTVRTQTGIWVGVMPNDGDWESPSSHLATMTLNVRRPA